MTDQAAIDRSLTRRFRYRQRLEAEGLQAWEITLCAEDIVHWLRQWGYTFDPRQSVSSLPFDPFPRQVEFLAWLAERESQRQDGLIEKSRDMGVTWLCCVYTLHGWLFREGFAAGFGSRKLELVDRLGDPDCIFEKIRFALYALPPWMLPKGFDAKAHDNHCRLLNPQNGSTITGEGGDNIGRGGRKSIYFVDEAAFLERPQSVDRALSQTTEVRIELSTPNGPGNPFATKRFSGKVPVFVFDWRDDPRKGEIWYRDQKEKLDPVTLAQEVDRDFAASIEGICIPGAWVRAAVDFDLGGWDGYMRVQSVAGLDVAEEGPAKCVFTSRRSSMVDKPRSWNADTTETAHRAADAAEELEVRLVCYDADGVGAGVRAAWRHFPRRLQFVVRPVRGGGPGTESKWSDGRLGKERFKNLRAELWWTLRCRFERTFAFREKGQHHAPEDMISIPNHPELIADLSLPRYFLADNGKIQIESKKDMKSRGVRSPDFADALVYSFAPGQSPGGYASGPPDGDFEAPTTRPQQGGFASGEAGPARRGGGGGYASGPPDSWNPGQFFW